MPSVFTQPVVRGFRGSEESSSTQPFSYSSQNFLFHEKFDYPCFNFEVFDVFFLRNEVPKKNYPIIIEINQKTEKSEA